jgi:predicted PurR-regulated permease PerM
MERTTLRISPQRAGQLALAVFAIAVVAWLLMSAGNTMLPFVFGLVLAYLLSPPVNWLAKRMPRPLAILLIYVLGILALTLFFVFVIPPLLNQTQRLLQNLPSVDTLRSWFTQLTDRYHEITPDAFEPQIEEAINNAIPSLQSGLTTLARNVLGFVASQIGQFFGLLSFLVGFLIVPIWLFYVLNDQRRGQLFFSRLVNRRIRQDLANAWHIIDRSLSAYIRGQLTLGVIIGVTCGVGLAILDLIPGIDIDYILLLAIWAGICELIPMIGALLGMVPAVIIAFVVGGPTSGVAVLILYVVVQQIENNLLVPRVIGESVGVHAAILTVMLVAMGSVFGLLGVITAAPVTAIARDLYLYAYRRLGSQTAQEALESISAPGSPAPK